MENKGLVVESTYLHLEQGSESLEADSLTSIQQIKEFVLHWVQALNFGVHPPCGSAMAVQLT